MAFNLSSHCATTFVGKWIRWQSNPERYTSCTSELMVLEFALKGNDQAKLLHELIRDLRWLFGNVVVPALSQQSSSSDLFHQILCQVPEGSVLFQSPAGMESFQTPPR